MANPLISICIPAYNSGKFIAETIESILKQRYTNWELIVVEDGTDDGTDKIVEQFRQSSIQRIAYFKNKINKGLPLTRKEGINNAQGDWICFLDGDDLWEPGHLEDLMNTAEQNKDCDLIHSGSLLFDSDTRAITEERFPSQDALKDFPVSLWDRRLSIQPSSVMISRKLVEKTGGPGTAYSYAEDLEMWLRFARAGFRFAYTGKQTCLYRQHASAMTKNAYQITFDTANVYQQNATWEKIPAQLRKNKLASIWLSTAKLIRHKDKALAVQYLNKSLSHKITFGAVAYRLFLLV